MRTGPLSIVLACQLAACVPQDAAPTAGVTAPPPAGADADRPVASDLRPTLTRGFEELVVSLTFDDTFDDQYDFARPELEGLPATFYVNSTRLGRPRYMSATQVGELVREGHEIGSHTLHHLHLAQLGVADQRTEMCNDRTALVALGFPVTTMAYPFGDDNASAHAVAASCPFAGARDVGGLRNSNPLAGGQGYCGSSASNLDKADAEQLHPTAPLAIRSRASIHTRCTLDDLRDMVQNAANDHKEIPLAGARWLVFNFHDFCDDCSDDTDTVRKDVFHAFVGWLRDQQGELAVRDAGGAEVARRPLAVRTVAQVLAVPR